MSRSILIQTENWYVTDDGDSVVWNMSRDQFIGPSEWYVCKDHDTGNKSKCCEE